MLDELAPSAADRAASGDAIETAELAEAWLQLDARVNGDAAASNAGKLAASGSTASTASTGVSPPRDPGLRDRALRELDRFADALAAAPEPAADDDAGRARAAGLWTRLATTLDAVGAPDRAADGYRTALRLDPESPIPLNNLAMLLLAGGERDGVPGRDAGEAVDLATRALAGTAEGSPARAPMLDTLGLAQLAAGRPADAADTLGRAARLQPTERQWLVHLGEAQRDAGRADDARRTLAAIDRLALTDGPIADEPLAARADALRASLK